MVSYDLNNSNEIDELTVETGTTVEDKAISSKGYFNGREINSDAVIFSYEGGDKDDDANYSVASYNSVLDSGAIDSVTYVLDNSKIVAMLLEGFSSGEDVYGVFTGYSAVSGDYDYEVTVLIDGTETTYSSDTNYSTLVAKNQGVYKLRFDGSGALRSDIASYAVADGAVADTTYAAITTTSESAISRSGNTLTVGDVTYTLDSGYSIYEWSEDDGCYVKGNIRDIVGVEDITVMLFDVYDDDLAYDIVLWYAD